MSKSYSIKRIWFIKLIRRREADFIFTYNKWKNPLLLDEADKRGEQHFYSRSSSCRKSFITFSRAMKEKKYPSTCIYSPSNHFLWSFR